MMQHTDSDDAVRWNVAGVLIEHGEDGGVVVRDTRHGVEAELSFTAEEWEAFVLGVKAGEFDPE